MEERNKSDEILSRDEITKNSSFSPEQTAGIVSASLMNQPEDSTIFRIFINSIHRNEQFLIQLMKNIQPQTTSFYESISGICETRKKEAAEKRKIEDAREQQMLSEVDQEELNKLENSIAEQQKQLEFLRKRLSKSVS